MMSGLLNRKTFYLLTFCVVTYQHGLLLTAIKTGAMLFVFLISFLLIKQENILYLPQPDPREPRGNTVDPKQFGMNIFDDVNLETDDGVLIHGWFIKQSSDAETNRSIPTLLYFHGNAGNISNRLPYFQQLFERCKINVIAADYRGYGDSEGSPSEEGLKLDARAFLDFVHNHEEIDPEKVIIFGRSLGGAVAIDLASSQAHRRLKGIIIENTFLSVPDIALVVYPFLKVLGVFLKKPFITSMWESKKSIGSITCPILFISGERDELIPPEHMKSLYRLCRRAPGTLFCKVKNGGHNDTPIHGGDEYYECMNDFMTKAMSQEPIDVPSPKAKRRQSTMSIESFLSDEEDDFHNHIFS